MKIRKARQIIWAIAHGHSKILNWKPETIRRAQQHRAKWNKRHAK